MRLDFSIFFSKFNKMEDGNLAILVDAKTEYTKQLVSIIAPYIYSGIKKIYIEAKEECFERDEMENTLRNFQKRLSEIPKWNQEIIDDEYTTIIQDSKCDWLEDLIMAVFVSHTRILTSINFNKNKNKVNLKIPKVDHFIHQCYIEVARCFWKNPYLFDDSINKYEFQRNRREAEQLIENQIHETIRRQLPVKNILREYLGTDYKEVEEQDDDVETDSNYQDNLRKLVKAEIKNCSKEKLEKFNIDEDNDMSLKNDILEEDASATATEDATAPVADSEEAAPTKSATEEEASPASTTEEEASPASTTEEEASPASTTEEATPTAFTSSTVTEEATPTESSTVTEEAAPLASTTEGATVTVTDDLLKDNKLDEAALSDNEIEKQEVTDIIEKEVEKLEMEPLNNGLQVEELNLDIDDLSLLEEVYQDIPSISNSPEPENPINTPQEEENIQVKIEEPPIKTIIIDTKKGGKIIGESDDLEINDYDEGSDSEDESSKIKQKVYNRYSKNRDYSFFN